MSRTVEDMRRSVAFLANNRDLSGTFTANDVGALIDALDEATARADAAESALTTLRLEMLDLEQWLLMSEPLFSARSGTVAEERVACGMRLGAAMRRAAEDKP